MVKQKVENHLSTSGGSMMGESIITVIGRQDIQERGPLGKVRDWFYSQEDVSVEKIRSELSDFLTSMQEILDGLPDKLADYELESMDISVEISSKGNVSLIAVGGELGGTGGLTIHLKKKSSSKIG
jgi:hypothetical protein